MPPLLLSLMFTELNEFVVPVLLTISGPAIHLYRPLHQMFVEERVKDGVMTEIEARRQMSFYRICASAMTTLGVAVFAVSIYRVTG